MTRTLTAIWVEDEPEKVEPNLPVLREFGIRCEITDVRDLPAVTARPRTYDLGIFDARLGPRERDGVFHARALVRSGAITSVLLVTRFLQDYVHPERQFDPRIPFRAVPKSDLARAAEALQIDGSGRGLADTGIPGILRELEESPFSARSPLPPAPALDLDDGGLLASVTVFYGSPLDAQIDLLERIHDAYREYADAIFEQTPEAAWVVIGAPSGEFLLWGDSLDDRPANLQSVVALAEGAVGPPCVPFTYTRPTYRIF